MKSIAASQVETSEPPVWKTPAAAGWLRALFWCSAHIPWFVWIARYPSAWLTVGSSAFIRRGTSANARRILGSDLTDRQCRSFARRVVLRFCDFVLAVGRSTQETPAQLTARVDSVVGRDTYLERRKRGDGAIVVTAHMGSFEMGLASLAEVERSIHVVFKRDLFDGFEGARKALREKLGVREAPIDDGWSTWMSLRDALRADEVIVLQADRAMPGQKCQSVPFLGGHLRLPVGPVKLALASGSPIFPIFTVMTSRTHSAVHIEPAIEVTPDDPDGALRKIAEAIERFVRQYPDQWLVLGPAFEEDEGAIEVRR